MNGARDTEYVYLSTRIKALERGLLTWARMERMLNAPSDQAAAQVLTECGYPRLDRVTGPAVEAALAQRQRKTLEELDGNLPGRAVVEIFQIQFDYHNAKVLVKAQAMGTDQDRLLMEGGRYAPEPLATNYRQGDLRGYSQRFQQAVARAREVLRATGDPQQADFALDRAHFEELAHLAHQTGSEFLTGYVALRIDAANLRAAVRASRLGMGAEFLRQVLVPGGTVSFSALTGAGGARLASAFSAGPLAAAAAAGAKAASPGGGSLTEFEGLCGQAVTDYFDQGRRVAFGVEPIAGYLYARQCEATAIRIILAGRMGGLEREAIRRHLRRSCC